MRAVGAVLARHGYELREDQLLPLIGPPLEVGIRLVTDMDEREALDVAAEYRELFSRTVTAEDIPDQLLPLIGPPLEVGIRLVTDMDEREALDVAAEYRELFSRTVTAEDIPLFPGTLELLDALVAAGKRIAVASSRIESSTVDLIAALGLTQFEVIAGRVPGIRETKADSISAALAALGARPCDAVMVGDPPLPLSAHDPATP